MPKKYLILVAIILVLTLVGLTGYFTYQLNVDKRLQASEELAKQEAGRVVDFDEDSSLSEPTFNELSPSTIDSESADPAESSERSFPEPSSLPAIIKTGVFLGEPDYPTSGSVSVIDEEDSIIIQFDENFNFGGAPDPFVYLGEAQGQRIIQEKALRLGALTSNEGKQGYRVSKEEFDKYPGSVILWCQAFDIFMARADFS